MPEPLEYLLLCATNTYKYFVINLLKKQFVIVHFTHGSGGKFLSTVLQTSAQIDHWSDILESEKSANSLFKELILNYVRRSFPLDHKWHLRSEPMVPYATNLYSTSYNRGNSVTLDQYLTNSIRLNDYQLLNAIKSKKLINIIFNKPIVPKFCHGSKAITILIEHPQEIEFTNLALWHKHFLETNSTIHYLPDDPEFCHFTSLPKVLKFKNDYIFPEDKKTELVEQKIINNHTRPWYTDRRCFVDHDQQSKLNNYFISLGSFFNVDKFLHEIDQIFNKFDLGIPDIDLIKQMHEIWISRQVSTIV